MNAIFAGRGRPTFRTACLALLACWTLAAAAVRAQPLADKVPADAVIYVGWNGYETKSPGFAGSHLEAVMKAAEFQKLVDTTIPQLLDKLAQKDDRAADVIGVAGPIVKPMLKHRTAIWIGKPQFVADQPPVVRAGLICEAGPDADALHRSLTDLTANAPQNVKDQLKVSKAGDAVVVTMNYDAGTVPAAGGGLVGSAGFKAVQAHVVKDASFALYVDADQFVKLMDEGVATYGKNDARDMWPKVRDALGVKGVKHVVCSSGFDGKDWLDHVYVHAPEPRDGFLKLADAKPVSDGALKAIPVTATAAGAFRFDAGKLLAEVRTAAGKIDPKAAQDIENGMADASRKIGMDLEKDVVNVFGDEWVYYVDPNVGGRSSMGVVLINKLKDPAKAEQSLTKLGKLAEDELAKAMRQPDLKVRLLTTKSGENTIHYVGTPLVSPAWAFKDGYLVIGLFPQVVAGALDQFGAGKSILDNPAYQQVRARLNVAAATGVGFADLPKTAPDGYATWVMLSRLTGFAEMFGVDAPAMLLPPLNRLMPHLTPAGSVSWVDKDGIHMKALSPFPGATVLAQDPFGGGGAMLPMMMMGMAQQRRVATERNFDAPPPRIEPEPVRPVQPQPPPQRPNTIP